MSTRGATPRLTQLWQLPLLLLSLGLLACAAGLFVDATPGLALAAKVNQARVYLKNDRPQAAVEHLNRLLASEKLAPQAQAPIHLLIAEATANAAQSEDRGRSGTVVAAHYTHIIEQIQIALAQGAKPSGEIYARLGESYEALGRPVEAVSNYRQAIALDPPHALRLQRKVIDLQISQSDWAPAEASLDGYLVTRDLTSAERAWALGEKAQLLIDRGETADAKPLLEDAARLDPDPISQGINRYRLGLCAWKSGDIADAERLIRSARGLLKQHPLDASAACSFGRILADKHDDAQAIRCFDEALAAKPDPSVAASAHLGRGVCNVRLSHDESGVSDLRELATEMKSPSVRPQAREDALSALRQVAQTMAARENFPAAIEVLMVEQSIQQNPPAGFFERLAAAYEKRADQLEQDVTAAPAAEKARRMQQFNETCTKAGDAEAAFCRALGAVKDAGAAEALWKSTELYARGGNTAAVVATLESFVSDHADHVAAPTALLKLAQMHEKSGDADKAISAYQRIQGGYPSTAIAVRGTVPLARLLIAKGSAEYPRAEKLLLAVVDAKDREPKEAESYRLALLELAKLYQHNSRLELALPRYEQFASLYPSDEHTPEAIFLAAEAQRKRATKDDHGASASASDGAAIQAAAHDASARNDALAKAAALYDRVLAIYKASPPSRDGDRRIEKLARFRRADCAFELERYAEARSLYQAAADAYHDDDVSAFAAAVQIVNCCAAMERPEEAVVANERAQALLRRLPADAGDGGGSGSEGNLTLPKSYLQQWMKWTSGSSGTL